MVEEDKGFEGFWAELCFIVESGMIDSASVVYNEGFSNEVMVELGNDSPCDVCWFGEGGWLEPSYLRFMDKGKLEFRLGFTDPSKGGERHQAAFVETLWELSHLGFRPSTQRRGNPRFLEELKAIMEAFSKIECGNDIDFTAYCGILF